jgi:hypothetical protein
MLRDPDELQRLQIMRLQKKGSKATEECYQDLESLSSPRFKNVSLDFGMFEGTRGAWEPLGQKISTRWLSPTRPGQIVAPEVTGEGFHSLKSLGDHVLQGLRSRIPAPEKF